MDWSEYFFYNHEDGVLYWRKSTCRSVKTGRQAGIIGPQGYIIVTLHGKTYRAHRIIWDLCNPENMLIGREQIDHINHIRTDNRLANLRKVDNATNGKNQKLRTTNSSGVTGVSWNRSLSKWQATIQVNGKSIYLGVYRNVDCAAAARKQAEIYYGFHKNHGAKNEAEE